MGGKIDGGFGNQMKNAQGGLKGRRLANHFDTSIRARSIRFINEISKFPPKALPSGLLVSLRR
jgi:hypothetical protein